MGSRHRGPAGEILALDVFIKFQRASNSLGLLLARHLRLAGLTEGQFGVLEALYHLGPLPPCDLSRKLLCTTGNMTTLLDNLEKHSLVKRTRAGRDRRFVTVSLAPKGRAAISRIFPEHARAIREAFACLTEREQETLAALAKKLGLSVAAVVDGERTAGGERSERR